MELLVEAFSRAAAALPEEAIEKLLAGRSPARLRLTPGRSSRSSPSVVELDPEALRADAARVLQEDYSDWALRFAASSGFASLYRFRGLSWWWLTGFSENSPLRTPLIRSLYWLLVIERALERHGVTRLTLATDDGELERSARDLAGRRGVAFDAIAARGGEASSPPSLAGAFARRLRRTLVLLLNWLILLAASPRLDLRRLGRRSQVVFFSRFPVLWERTGGRLRERMFGDLPEHVRRLGHGVVYAAVLSLGPRRLLGELSRLRREAREERIVFLEALWSFEDLLQVSLRLGPVRRYLAWRSRPREVRFHGILVTGLLLRELDRELLSDDLPFNLGVLLGVRRLLRRLPRARAFVHPFEYQPMERALSAGARAARSGARTVGLQAGIFASNHLGFLFPSGPAREDARARGLGTASLPDLLVAYGRSAHDAWRARLPAERVLLAGAVRYPDLGVARAKAPPSLDLPPGARILVLGTSVREETLAIVDAALDAARELGEAFFLFKFHYHCELSNELAERARARGVSRYRTFDGGLAELIGASRAVVTGGSGTALEAIALGTMPVVYAPPGEWSSSPLFDIPEAAFLWSRPEELTRALRECLVSGPACREKEAAWPRAIETMLHRLDGRSTERLTEWLVERGVL
jgi:hypothetical protein